jgi:hypothetical protein
MGGGGKERVGRKDLALSLELCECLVVLERLSNGNPTLGIGDIVSKAI